MVGEDIVPLGPPVRALMMTSGDGALLVIGADPGEPGLPRTSWGEHRLEDLERQLRKGIRSYRPAVYQCGWDAAGRPTTALVSPRRAMRVWLDDAGYHEGEVEP